MTQAWDGVVVAKGSTVVYVGNVPAGTPDSRLFNLTNTGNATLTITNPTTLVSGANWSEIVTPVATLAPGATTSVRVRILSSTGGTFTGTVSISSNDTANNPFTFSVQATVDPPPAPNVQVSRAWDGVNVSKGSTVVYVGNVPAGTSDSRLFNLTNTGNATLNLSNPNTLVSGANWYL
ncbi:MAG TPA: choice-of-anchor D domain-containing protein, partial [Thermoanaerobaculia bacterium]|nr:choice-of-anchor D domain-containing protein [Thermoanaerobaculia bacterium]